MMLRKLISTRFGLAFALVTFAACADCLNSVPGVLADEKTSPAKKEPWKPEDFIYGESAGQFRISPDAKWVVWVKTRGDKAKDAGVSNLVLSSLTESREIPLTRGGDTNPPPRCAPDGEGMASP